MPPSLGDDARTPGLRVATRVALGALALAGVAASLWAAPGAKGLAGAGLALIALAIAVIDARHMLIPNELNAVALALALVNAYLSPPLVDSLAMLALRGAVTFLIFLAIRVAFRRLRGREGLGLGDVKLAFVAGAWLDWLMIALAVEIAALAALALYLAWPLITRRPLALTARLPFGLFFAPAIWLAWLIGTLAGGGLRFP
jgi:leader peptidase (prepilin peptidase)/N-methyltransferase